MDKQIHFKVSQTTEAGVATSTPVDMGQLDDIVEAAPDPLEIRVDVDKDETTIVDANGVVTKIPGSTIGTTTGIELPGARMLDNND